MTTVQEETRMNNRYEHAKIYKLIHPDSEYFYIGSTCDVLSKRLCVHRNKAKIYPERKVYKAFGELGFENVKIVLMEEHYLENREQQLREESRVIQMYIHVEKCLSSYRPWVSKEEWKNYYEEYRIKNKEIIRNTQKEYE